MSLEPKSSEVSETMDLNESQKSEKDEFKSNIETVEQEITLTQPDTELLSLNTSSNVPKEKSFDSFLTEDLMDRFANKVAVTTRVQVLQALHSCRILVRSAKPTVPEYDRRGYQGSTGGII